MPGTWWSVVSEAAETTGDPVLQVAADGVWEHATVVGDAADVDAILSAVAGAATRDVAAELLWPDQAFVGVRWSLAEVPETVDALVRTRAGWPRHGRPGTPGDALVALLGGPPAPRVERVELGAVNAWGSVGPELLWDRDQPGTPSLTDLPTRRPDLVRCTRPVAVEVAAVRPRACWAAVVVSVARGEEHVVQLSSVGRLLGSVLAATGQRPGG